MSVGSIPPLDLPTVAMLSPLLPVFATMMILNAEIGYREKNGKRMGTGCKSTFRVKRADQAR